MTATAYSPPTAGGETSSAVGNPMPAQGSAQAIPEKYREYKRQAQIDRRRFEPVWQLCQSFLQNRQWVGWNYHERRIVELPNPEDRVRVTVNVLTQYLWTFLGKLSADDFLPDIKFRRDDQISRAFARQTTRAVEWGWEEEWEGDEKMLETLLYMGAFGIGGLRVRPDPAHGNTVAQFPLDQHGTLHVTDKHDFMANALQSGESYDMHDLREGRLVLDPLSPFNMLAPPGLVHERDFPWFGIERPIALSTLKPLYKNAAGLNEEPMRAIDMIGVREDTGPVGFAGIGAGSGVLRGHVRLYTFFEMPTPDQPEGEMVIFAGNTLLDGPKPLPFQIRGQGKAGLVFFKYHPVPGRWWPIGVVEPGIGPQRQRNRARSQWIEMKDRAGLGRVFATKGTITSVNRPKGGIFELVEIAPGHDFPKETQGVPPGQWLQAEVSQNDADLNLVMGLQDVSLGQAPAGVSAYSAFALLAEQDDRRVGPVMKHVRLEVAKLTKILMCGMRTYWLPGKMIPFTGEDGDELLDQYAYDSTQLPDDALVQVGKGAPMPQSQAAETQKIFDIFDRSISSGQALALSWLFDSLKQGKALPIPEQIQDMQLDAAQLENNLMAQGNMPQVRPYDNDELHIQEHRQFEGMIQFIPTMANVVGIVEAHIQLHQQAMIQKQQMQVVPGQPNPAGMGALGGTGGQAGAGAPAPGGAPGGGLAAFIGPQHGKLPAIGALRNESRQSPRPPNVAA